jgi:hypothetical protein
MLGVVYVSSAVALFQTADLVDVLEVSGRNNARDAITGLLLYKGGNFMQLLEGDDEAVWRVHARITQDPRHRGIMTILQEPIETRLFTDWSMAFGNLDDPAVASLDGISGFLDQSLTDPLFTADPRRGLSLLRSFRQSMR